jgi:tRNA1(Val) A37 N6-methylase TrmN6
MGKILLKLLMVFVTLDILKILFGHSRFGQFLFAGIFLLVSALLFMIIHALVTELKIFQGGWINRNKTKAARPYLKMKYSNIEVSYLWPMNGGGILLAYEFIHIISQKIGKVGHIFEYCSGPGFIGFGLLANNLCDRLTLADVNPEAVEAVKETIKNNNLQDRVTVYQSDCLDSIPQNEQWDLVVGNPPWDLVMGKIPWYQGFKNKKDVMVCDPDGRVHEKFYQGIKKFLKPQGTVLFVEGGEFTRVDRFKDMIENNGFRIIESFKAAPFLEIFRNFNEYRGLEFPLFILLRFALCFREAYFIWSGRKGAEAVEELRKRAG